jgi:hypothetical protein
MSNRITFPPNPSDGTIFEASPGLFYQYRKSDNTWVRIDGSEALPLASPLQDGLMTSEDLRKLSNLIIPPPQASIKGEDCALIFRQGRVGLYSSDGSLIIEKSLDLVNKAGPIGIERPWDLHRNTVGINFGLNLEQFLDEVKKRGNIIEKEIRGDQGTTGDRGEAGRDRLDTGPVGSDGQPGLNSPFEGSIIQESLNIQVEAADEPRAIVDVTTEEISEDENYLVFTRANIGNPDACPSEVIPRTIKSPWVLVIQQGVTTIRKLTKLTDDCGVPCAVCTGAIYYLNVDPLLVSIFERFKEMVTSLKKAKEELVASWLKSMVYLFNQQKAALCCALENCKSRTRNIGTRQYIESQRIQAALGDFSLVVDGAEDRLTVDLDEFKECLGKPTGQPQQTGFVKENLGAGCGDWLYEVTVDASIHNRDPRNAGNQTCLMVQLPAGTYYAQIIACCAQIGVGDAVAPGAAAAEVAFDDQGRISEIGTVYLDGIAYEGAPVPGKPGSIFVRDPNTGAQKEVTLAQLGVPDPVTYTTRKAYTETPSYTGRVAILYDHPVKEQTNPVAEDDEGSAIHEQRVVVLPDIGKFADPGAARSAYNGLTASFQHAGGPI